jgi:hypothetical protein
MAKNIDLIKIFGVEGMVTPKTLVTETVREVNRKTPMEATEDIKSLLDEMTVRAVSGDLSGVEECLHAIQLRVTLMKNIADALRKGEIK